MQTITAYKSSDGKLFVSKEECDSYERGLSWVTRIEEFMKAKGVSKNQGGILRKYLPMWEEHNGRA